MIWPLSDGQNAFVGRLELEPGAQVPPNRDETDEIVVMLAGHGRVTLDGEEHAVGPGDTVTMAAGVEAAYRNEAQRMVALQVFAGPGPAAKYAEWKPLGPDGGEPTRVERVGPFLVACTGGQCTIWHGGETVGEPVWHYGDPAATLRPLGGGILTTAGEAWLLSQHAGDGCPVVYEALCVVDGKAKRSASFGNCNEPDVLRSTGPGVELTFAAMVEPEVGLNRPGQVVSIDALACTVTPEGVQR
ncbi:MAG: cupin domain-containing protein [Alphaproteobacteria bacterium]|nr:cupin domain-containing protein [Alphaproteobacteria bacterium]